MKYRRLIGIALVSLAMGSVWADGETTAKAKGCLGCHGIDHKIVGPGYKDVAAKYKGDAAATTALAEKIKKGGSGNWGAVPMPPQATLTDAEIQELVSWILAQ